MALTPVEVTPRFRRAYRKKTVTMRDAVDDAVLKLRTDPTNVGLQAKKIQGQPGVFESRIDRSNRLTWHWEDDTIVLRNHCNHDILNRRP